MYASPTKDFVGLNYVRCFVKYLFAIGKLSSAVRMKSDPTAFGAHEFFPYRGFFGYQAFG